MPFDDRPQPADLARITGIALVLSIVAAGAAFWGAGVAAIIGLIVLVGPLSIYGNSFLTAHTGHRAGADTPSLHS